MSDLHLCDLVLSAWPGKNGSSVEQLALRPRAMLADLTQLLMPCLVRLQFGDIEARVIQVDRGSVLRVFLSPRRRSLLVDPMRHKPTIEDEVALLREEIGKLDLVVTRAARIVKGRRQKSPKLNRDPLHAIVVRRSRQQWVYIVENRQLELAFPDCPRYIDDTRILRAEGVVHRITARLITLRGVTIGTGDDEQRPVATMPTLPIRWNVLDTQGSGSDLAPVCERPWGTRIRLHWCSITGVLVGAEQVSPAVLRYENVRAWR